MENKTPLERDIERIESFKTPWGVKVLIVLLITCLSALGLYTLDLKKKVTIKEKEIAEIKELFQDDRSALLEEIRELSREVEAMEPE